MNRTQTAGKSKAQRSVVKLRTLALSAILFVFTFALPALAAVTFKGPEDRQ